MRRRCPLSDISIPTPPTEDLTEEKKKLKDQLEVEATRSKTLYHQYYQQMIRDKMPKTPAAGGGRSAMSSVTSDILSKVRDAYADAFALKAFREVLGPEQQQPTQQQPAQQPAEGEGKSKFIDAWTRWAERDPEKAKEFIQNLSEEEMAKIAYLDTSKDAKDADLRFFQLMGSAGKNTSVQDMLAIVDKLNKGPTVEEYVNTSLALADRITPKQPEGGNPEVVAMRSQVDRVLEANEKLRESIHQMEISRRDEENTSLRQELKEIRGRIPTTDQLFDMALQQEQKLADWAEKRGYKKGGGGPTDQDKQMDFLNDMADRILTHLDPLVDAGAERIKSKIEEPGQPKPPKTAYRKFRCSPDGCGGVFNIPWPIPDGFQTKCPHCGKVWEKPGATPPPQQQQPPPQQQQPPPSPKSKGAGGGYYVETV